MKQLRLMFVAAAMTLAATNATTAQKQSQSSFAAKYGQNAVNYAAAVQLLKEVCKDKGKELKNLGTDSLLQSLAPPAKQSEVSQVLTAQKQPQFQNLTQLIANPLDTSVSADILHYRDLLALIKVIDSAKLQKPSADPAKATPLSASQTIVVYNQVAAASGGGSSGGGVSLPLEARIINAAADLIIDRLQQELAMSFFGKMKKDLENDSVLRYVMPRTKQFLQAVVDKPLLLPSLGASWKAAFEEDAKNIPWNFAELWRVREGLDTNITEYGDCIRVLHRALETYDKIKSGMHPADIIHHFAIKAEETGKARTSYELSSLQHTVRLFDHISQHLLSNAGRGGWVGRDGLKFLEDDDALKLFLRIVVEDESLRNQEKNNSVFYTRRKQTETTGSTATLQWMDKNFAAIRPLLHEFQLLATAVDRHIANIQSKKSKGEKVAEEDYFSYVKTTYELIKFGHKMATLGYDEFVQAEKDAKEKIVRNFTEFIVPIGESGGRLALAAQNGKFGTALAELMTLFEKIQEKRTQSLKDEAAGKLSSVRDRLENSIANDALEKLNLPPGSPVHAVPIAEIVQEATKWAPTDLNAQAIKGILMKLPLFDNPLYTKLLRYVSFMTDVINAETVEETKQALQSAALPAGSYSLKRKSPFSVNITAYPGLAIGGEGIKDSATGKFGLPSMYFQPSVPVGVDFSTSLSPIGVIGGVVGAVAALPQAIYGIFDASATPNKTFRSFVEFSNGLGSWLISSTTLHISIADLGNLVTYRLAQENDTVNSYPVVGLRQVFAPGVAVMFGLGKESPFSFGGGFQLAPKLREIKDEKAVERERDAFRYFFTIAADLPFFNFYTAEPSEELP